MAWRSSRRFRAGARGLAARGGTVILRSPPGGGYVVVTAYGHAEQSAVSLALDLSRLDRPPAADEEARTTTGTPTAGVAGPHGQGQEVPTEILLHIERAGDRLFPGRGWVGALGRKLRIEAFSIRPMERIAPADIEFKGFLPRGGETQWVQGGVICGTRGRRLPLIGLPRRDDGRSAGSDQCPYRRADHRSRKGAARRLSDEPRYRAVTRLATALRLAVSEPHPLVCP